MKKLTRIEDVGDFLFGVPRDSNFWIAKFENGNVKWRAADHRGKLVVSSYNKWNDWTQSFQEMQKFVVRPIIKQEEGMSDVAYKIRILEQKFLNRKQHAVGYSG